MPRQHVLGSHAFTAPHRDASVLATRGKAFTRQSRECVDRTVMKSQDAAGRGPDAALILEMSTEFNPDAPWVHHLLGEARLASGDRPRALEAFERALALGPDNPVTRRKIEELKAPPPKP